MPLETDTTNWSGEGAFTQLLIEPSPQLRGFWQRAGFEDMTLRDLLQA